MVRCGARCISQWFTICRPATRYHLEIGWQITRRIEYTDLVILHTHATHPDSPHTHCNIESVSQPLFGESAGYEIKFADTRQEWMSGEGAIR